MCVSLLIEPRLETLASLLGVSRLVGPETLEADSGPRRLEPNALAPVVRMGPNGKLVVEAMRFRSYVIKRDSLEGDMLADSMLTRSHGLVALQGFSEWVSTLRLVSYRILPEHEVHCAFNRFALPLGADFGVGGMRDRQVLANFRPVDARHLLVPVLYTDEGEFVVVSDEPSSEIAEIGARLSPVTLGREAALAWLSTAETDGAEDVDFLEILADQSEPSLSLTLYKSA